MNKLDTRPPAIRLPLASIPDPEAGRRLIVLLPESEADPAHAARRIWELANALGYSVQLVGLCKDETGEASLRRQMVTLAAMLENGNGPVTFNIEFGTNWLDAIQPHWQAGDALVCFAGQRFGLTRRPLYQMLESNLRATVYVLSEAPAPRDARPNRLSSILAWTGSIGIILGFFWLQARIEMPPKDGVHTAMLMLSIPVEVWLVWVWNSLFG